MEEADLGGHARRIAPTVGLVGDHDDARNAFGLDLLGHGDGMQLAVDVLAAGHGDGVVIQDLVGDVDVGGDRLADGQQARMEIGAVAEIGEDVRLVGKGGLAHPGDTLPAHMGADFRVPVGHELHHVVAADAGRGARALGYGGRGIVRAAGAIEGFAGMQGDDAVLRRRPLAQAFGDGAALVGARTVGQGCEQGQGDVGGVEVERIANQRGAVRVGLADHHRTAAVGQAVEHGFQLVFDEIAALFNDQNRFQAVGEIARRHRIERPHQADLPQAQADIGRLDVADLEQAQGVENMQEALAGGGDAEARPGRVTHHAVETVGAHEGLGRRQPIMTMAYFLGFGRIVQTDV